MRSWVTASSSACRERVTHSGISRRFQSVSNMLREFGLQVPAISVSSRNVAAVMVTASLPGTLRIGDHLDANVSSIGDARSLAGGTLLYTPLIGSDRNVYAAAQGALAVGGYRFEQNGNVEQKNFPTSGTVVDGAVAQRAVAPALARADGSLDLILNEPDYTTGHSCGRTYQRCASAESGRCAGVGTHPVTGC